VSITNGTTDILTANYLPVNCLRHAIYMSKDKKIKFTESIGAFVDGCYTFKPSGNSSIGRWTGRTMHIWSCTLSCGIKDTVQELLYTGALSSIHNILEMETLYSSQQIRPLMAIHDYDIKRQPGIESEIEPRSLCNS